MKSLPNKALRLTAIPLALHSGIMEKRLGIEVLGGAGCEAERSEARGPYGVRLGRAGRRSVDEPTEAMVELLSGVPQRLGHKTRVVRLILSCWGEGSRGRVWHTQVGRTEPRAVNLSRKLGLAA